MDNTILGCEASRARREKDKKPRRQRDKEGGQTTAVLGMKKFVPTMIR